MEEKLMQGDDRDKSTARIRIARPLEYRLEKKRTT